VVDVGLTFPTEEREITLEEAHNFCQNAQAVAMLVSSLALNEFNKVNGREITKDIWEVLRTSFEGDKSLRKGNIELLHGELERFVFLEGESTQAMFDRMMSFVNRIRSIGSTDWDENKVARKILRTYRAKNNMLASVIMERPEYNFMTPQEVVAKLKHHECLDQDTIDAHSQNPNAMGYNKNVALKAAQAHECNSSCQQKKKVKDDSSSGEEDSNKKLLLSLETLESL
jgi:hypothetical protein